MSALTPQQQAHQYVLRKLSRVWRALRKHRRKARRRAQWKARG